MKRSTSTAKHTTAPTMSTANALLLLSTYPEIMPIVAVIQNAIHSNANADMITAQFLYAFMISQRDFL